MHVSGMKFFSVYTDFSVSVSFSADFIVAYCYNLHFFFYFQPELGLFTLVSWGFLSFLEHFQCFSAKAIFMSDVSDYIDSEVDLDSPKPIHLLSFNGHDKLKLLISF